MGFLDSIEGMAEQGLSTELTQQAGEHAGVMGCVLQMVNSPEVGGVQGVMQKFQQGGLGSMAQSWAGGGEAAQELTPEHVEQVLGPDRIAAVASKCGMSPDDAKAKIAEFLPMVIGHLAPAGQAPQAS
jgi:uncharacterized protein YidB (DUF937 family)